MARAAGKLLNRFSLDLYGLTDKSWQGKTDLQLAELSHPCYRESFAWNRQSDEQVWQSGSAQQLTENIVQSDGRKRIFDITKTPLFDVDGSRRALVVFGEDITENMNADRQIRLANQVLTNSDEAVLISDADNRIVFINEAFSKITGFAMKDVLGHKPAHSGFRAAKHGIL